MSVHAVHHITAVTARIGDNLRYYTETLGLRLVKRSVNQDDVSAYHLFYADAAGSPGTDMTFFDWPNAGENVPGSGTISRTSFNIPGGSLDWWSQRLGDSITGHKSADDGRESIQFVDPEGQRLELVDATGLPTSAKPWAAHVPVEHAIRGILGVDLASARSDATAKVLTEVLGYRSREPNVFVTEGDGTTGRVRLVEPESRHLGRVGAGGVHHVAFRVADEAELLKLEGKIKEAGLRSSGVIDRYYFRSVYFSEPGGVLCELATDGPGFAADEEPAKLGMKLSLPPFLESHRARIEAGLKPLPDLG